MAVLALNKQGYIHVCTVLHVYISQIHVANMVQGCSTTCTTCIHPTTLCVHNEKCMYNQHIVLGNYCMGVVNGQGPCIILRLAQDSGGSNPGCAFFQLVNWAFIVAQANEHNVLNMCIHKPCMHLKNHWRSHCGQRTLGWASRSVGWLD